MGAKRTSLGDALDAAYQDGTLAEHLNEIPDLTAEARRLRRQVAAARTAHRRLVHFTETADIGIEHRQHLDRILLDWRPEPDPPAGGDQAEGG
jgi:hypothetical protein